MRDDNNYSSMSLEELKKHLESSTKELATWSSALANVKKDRHVDFLTAYGDSHGKSVSERRMEAEMATAHTQSEIFEYEGNVAFHQNIRDMIVVLIMSWTDG